MVHQPTRLAIRTALWKLEVSDFVYLAGLQEITNGNPSTHLGKLQSCGLPGSERVLRNRKPRTLPWLTLEGKQRISQHWQFMVSMEGRIRHWVRTEGHQSWTGHLRRVYGG